MNFEWDEKKRVLNIKKHGIDFADAPELFEGMILTLQDERFPYKEERFISFGLIKGRVVAVVHTEQEETIRVISMRKATKNETKAYFQNLPELPN